MRTILYTQGEDKLDKDKIIIDGVSFNYDSSNKDLWDNQTILLEKKGLEELNLNPSLFQKKPNLSSNLKCFFAPKIGIYFQGLYRTRVNSGSRNYYMFFAETDDIDEAIKLFKTQSKDVLHYEWDANDINWIADKFKKKTNSKWIIVTFILAIIAIVIVIILKSNIFNIYLENGES